MFILSIGLVAVASIFPVAAYLQRQAYEEDQALVAKRNAEAIIYARGVKPPPGVSDTKPDVVKFEDGELSGARWPHATRAYPMSDFNGDDLQAEKRDFYWVPLIMDKDKANGSRHWQVFVFILKSYPDVDADRLPPKKSDDANPGDPPRVPIVRRADAEQQGDGFNVTGLKEGELQAGDQILDNKGGIHSVVFVKGGEDSTRVNVSSTFSGSEQPTAIWYGVPFQAGKTGPTRRIIALSEEAVDR
jgi:hypothetical protein